MNTSRSSPSNASIAASLACLKTFQTIVDSLPEHIQQKCVLQILPLSTIASFTSWRNYSMNRKLLKSYCFSIYSKCSTNLLRLVPCKSLTSFGPSADRGNTCSKYGLRTTTFTPPYVLTPTRVDTNGSASHKTLQTIPELSFRESLTSSSSTLPGQDCKVLFVTYCLSHDHRWILVTCTDLVGHILHVNTINVERSTASSANNRKKAAASKQTTERRGPGLEKLWEYVLSILSKSAMPWRVVIGRFGRLGHGEVKGYCSIDLRFLNLGENFTSKSKAFG